MEIRPGDTMVTTKGTAEITGVTAYPGGSFTLFFGDGTEMDVGPDSWPDGFAIRYGRRSGAPQR